MAEEKDKLTTPKATPKAKAKSTTKAAAKKSAKSASEGKEVKKAAEAKTTAKATESKAKAPKKAAAKKDAKPAKAEAKSATKPADAPKAKAEKKPSKTAAAPKAKPKATSAPKNTKNYVPRLKIHYKEKVIPFMLDKFNYSNPNMVPKLTKISINSRISTSRDEVKDLESITEDITIISGQKAVVTRAKKAIANFKIREGDPVGATVTIRGRRMYEFLDRMISIAIPRVRDFNGLREKSFDGFGNFSFGVKEQIIFPEIEYDKVDKIRGMDITIVTNANTDEEGFELLKSLGLPFRILESAGPGN